MKNLRTNLDRKFGKNSIRFFGVCEYGGNFNRPHYHYLIFNFPLWLDFLEWMQRYWPYGNVHVDDPVSKQRIAYVTKYCLKQVLEEDETFNNDDNDKEEGLFSKPFMLCSRRPAIGHGFLSDDTKQYFRTVERYDLVTPSGQRVGLPRYYRDKIFTDPYQRFRMAMEAADKLAASKPLTDSERLQLWNEFNKKIKRLNSKEL